MAMIEKGHKSTVAPLVDSDLPNYFITTYSDTQTTH